MMRFRDRMLLLALGALFLALGIYTIFSIIEEHRFVTGEFVGWIEADATIEDYQASITDCVKTRKEYTYYIQYEYTVSFDTPAGRVSVHNSMVNQERRASPGLTADSFAPLVTGEAGALSYDPENPEDYRWGRKDDITKAASSPLRILICAVFIAGSAMIIWLAIRPLIKKKEKNLWHETDD